MIFVQNATPLIETTGGQVIATIAQNRAPHYDWEISEPSSEMNYTLGVIIGVLGTQWEEIGPQNVHY